MIKEATTNTLGKAPSNENSWAPSCSVFFFLNLQQTTAKSTSLSQNVSPLLLSLLLLSSLSGCRALRDAKNPPLPTLSVVTPVESPTQNFQNLPSHSLWNAFYASFLLSASAPPHFSSPSALESPTISPRTPTYSTPPPITRWATAPHKSTIAYPLRIHMDSRWIAINL